MDHLLFFRHYQMCCASWAAWPSTKGLHWWMQVFPSVAHWRSPGDFSWSRWRLTVAKPSFFGVGCNKVVKKWKWIHLGYFATAGSLLWKSVIFSDVWKVQILNSWLFDLNWFIFGKSFVTFLLRDKIAPLSIPADQILTLKDGHNIFSIGKRVSFGRFLVCGFTASTPSISFLEPAV